jgi:hypothetical protein
MRVYLVCEAVGAQRREERKRRLRSAGGGDDQLSSATGMCVLGSLCSELCSRETGRESGPRRSAPSVGGYVVGRFSTLAVSGYR